MAWSGDGGPVDAMSVERRGAEPTPSRSKGRSRDGVRTPPSTAALLRWLTRFTAFAVLLVGGLWGFEHLESFLIHDQRFALASPPDYGTDSPSLHIEGLHYASKVKVLNVFAADFDRSVYLMPLQQRRRQLIAVDWVKDATLSRIWPNQVTIQMTERKPVAFVTLALESGLAQTGLIDTDGVILQTPSKSRFQLPVLTGVKAGDSQESRRARVRHMERLLQEIGPLGEKLSEIDVTDRDNLKVTVQQDHRALVLLLGERNFARRLQNFVNHYAEIRKRLPNATTLDLRLEDRITVVE